jgi:tetratricopeptide (TPR) repeat protein
MAKTGIIQRYGIDWGEGRKDLTKKDYKIIFTETTKIIEDKSFPDKDELSIAYYDRGIIYSDRGEYQKAINDYSSAIEIDGRIEAIYNRGGLYYHLEQYFLALKDFLKFKELDFGDPPTDVDIDKNIDETKKKLLF